MIECVLERLRNDSNLPSGERDSHAPILWDVLCDRKDV